MTAASAHAPVSAEREKAVLVLRTAAPGRLQHGQAAPWAATGTPVLEDEALEARVAARAATTEFASTCMMLSYGGRAGGAEKASLRERVSARVRQVVKSRALYLYAATGREQAGRKSFISLTAVRATREASAVTHPCWLESLGRCTRAAAAHK